MANAKGSLSYLRFVKGGACKTRIMKVTKEAREIACAAPRRKSWQPCLEVPNMPLIDFKLGSKRLSEG